MHTTGKIREKIQGAAILFALVLAFGVTAHANVTASPTAINFGNQAVGTTSRATAVTLTNNSWRSTTIVSVFSSSAQFSYSGPSLPITLALGQSLTASVTFSPTAAQSYAGTLTFTRGNGSTFAVALNGTGTSTPTQAQPPAITSQPVSETVTAGQVASFSVAVTGTAPVTYQWIKNGATISGATSSSYATPATTISDNGAQFSVVVSNSAGNATSTAATLKVNPVPPTPGCLTSSGTWVNSPLSQTETGSFRVTFDATPLAAAIDGVTGLSSGPAGDYTNLAAIVRFNETGKIDARNSTAYAAASAIPYSAGTTYHFILDVNVAAHTYSAYVMVGSVQTTIGSNFAFRAEQATVSFLSNIGAVTSIGSQTVCNVALSAATAKAPTITTQPASQTMTVGQTATFTVAATGTAPMTFQWMKNGTAMSGATSSSYATPAITSSDNAAQFTVVVSNSAGNTTSAPAILTVIAAAVAPTITTQPLSQIVTAGQAATFKVTATGTALMTYQWKKNGTAISGAASSTYTTPLTTTSDNAAQFNVVVTNSAGSATSSTATLTVSVATLVLNASSTALAFGNVTLSTSSSQNVTLINAGNSNITISNVSVSGAGFGATGASTGLILTPGQTATLKATFTPAATGSVTGNVSVISNATNSPDTIALSGTGLAQVNHSVSLSWTPSTSTVIGYNSYSSTISGGPYVKLNMAPVPTTTYTDTTVQAGRTYYYVVTAVDSTNVESAFSTEISANIP